MTAIVTAVISVLCNVII